MNNYDVTILGGDNKLGGVRRQLGSHQQFVGEDLGALCLSICVPINIPGENVAIKTGGEKEASVAVIFNVLDPVCVTFKLMQFMFQEPDIPESNSRVI